MRRFRGGLYGPGPGFPHHMRINLIIVRPRIKEQYSQVAAMDEQDKAKDILIRQYAYFQYLFEQEQNRAKSIVNGAKIYIAFLVFILGSIFLKVLTAEKLIILANSAAGSVAKIIGISLVILTAMILTAAVAFTVLVLKVWSYDRLCDPIERFKETLTMKNELEVLSKSISDIAVATSRNNRINNMRARYLTLGLKYLLIGTFLSIITTFVLSLFG